MYWYVFYKQRFKIHRALGFARARKQGIHPRRHRASVSHRARRPQRSRGRRSKHLQNARPDDDEDKKSQHDGPDGEMLLLRHPRVHRTATVNVSVKLTRLVRHHAMRGSLDASERTSHIARQSSIHHARAADRRRCDAMMRRDLRAVASTPRPRAGPSRARKSARTRARSRRAHHGSFERRRPGARARQCRPFVPEFFGVQVGLDARARVGEATGRSDGERGRARARCVPS